jgi:hypothetical protein
VQAILQVELSVLVGVLKASSWGYTVGGSVVKVTSMTSQETEGQAGLYVIGVGAPSLEVDLGAPNNTSRSDTTKSRKSPESSHQSRLRLRTQVRLCSNLELPHHVLCEYETSQSDSVVQPPPTIPVSCTACKQSFSYN